jgi:hypothetical protein
MKPIPKKKGVSAAACLVLLALFFYLPMPSVAQYQKAPPDFGESYSFPSPVHP